MIVLACTYKRNKKNNIWVDKFNGVTYNLPDTNEGRPISFCLKHPNVSNIAKVFYRGAYSPSDADYTKELLALTTIKDSTLRPFYKWCLDFTISIS